MSIIDRTIVALDQMSIEEIEIFLSRKDNSLKFVKIGLELFLQHGPSLVKKIHDQYKMKIFLDLKLHDIPVTVERAILSLKNLPIDFLTIHISGGEEMLNIAMKSARLNIPNCKILGVSFLTSLETKDLEMTFGIKDTNEAFLRLFKMADKSKLDGVICSPHELTLVKSRFPRLLAITPGIRFADEITDQLTQDQKRVSTPKTAFEMGADFLVIGRSLTKALDLNKRIIELSSL